MELTWINKLRITAVAALGIIVIGVLAWPLAAPIDPLLPVRAWSVGISGTVVLLLAAFATGFTAYFIAWPNGREIGILAVPFGLTIWAGRSGPMRALTQAYNEPMERDALMNSLRFEPACWLLIVAAGFAGVLLAQHLRQRWSVRSLEPIGPKGPEESKGPRRNYINGAIALVAAVLISHFFVGAIAQNVATSRDLAPAQPAMGQIIFAVIVAFGIAAFVIKRFLNLSYIWPAVASVFLTAFADALYYNSEAIQRFAETRPATSFPHSVLAILPLQLVALGTVGSIIGYWLAVRYEWWRKHESA